MGLAVRGDGGPNDLAAVVLLHPRRPHADGATDQGHPVRSGCVGDSEGDVAHAVTVRPDMRGDHGIRYQGAGDDDAYGPALEDVRRAVVDARLRSRVGRDVEPKPTGQE